MAENIVVPILEIREEFATCEICLDDFDDGVRTPRTLPCFHTFCCDCLENIWGGAAQGVNCPKCRKIWPVKGSIKSSFQQNNMLMHMVEYICFKKKLGDVLCNQCPDNKATVRCLECERYLCETCDKWHAIFLEKHKPVPLTELVHTPRTFLKTPSMCPVHGDKNIDVYCKSETCEKAMCTTCALVSHKEHDICDLREFCNDKKKKISSSLDAMKKASELRTEYKSNLVEQNAELDKIQEQAMKDIDEHSDKLMEKVKKTSKNLKQKVMEKVAKQKSMRDEQLALVDKSEEMKTEHVLYCQQALAFARDVEFVEMVESLEKKGKSVMEDLQLPDLKVQNVLLNTETYKRAELTIGQISIQVDRKDSIFTGFTFPSTQIVKPRALASSHEEEKVEEYFKPLIDLPELVEVKTGEEDEKKLFGERSRLFRFDAETRQWKERGIGEMKILESIDGKRFRILMRREQVLKICVNHNISVDMKLIPLPTSDKAWCWTAMDFADESMKTGQFTAKFKTKNIAANFKEIFESCQKDLADKPTGSDAPVVHEVKAASTDAPQKDKDQQSFADKFKPKRGSWECSGCYCRNDADVLKCPACYTLKLGTKPEDIGSKGGSSIGGGFTFGSGYVGGPSRGYSFTLEKPQSIETVVTTGSKEYQQSFADKFKPKPGSWECTGCYCRNEADVLKCPACQTLKPGVKQDEVPAHTGKMSTGGGFQFGTAGGFTFGAKTTQPKETKMAAVAEGKEISFADKFKPKPGSWECTGCYCRNDANVLQCPACQTLKPGIKKEDLEQTSRSQAESKSGGGGFKFGSAGGFTFGKPHSKNQPTDSFFTPKSGSWECTGCYCRNEADILKCPACQTLKPGVKAAPVAEGKGISFADKFKPKPGSWECTGCYCRNDANVLQCPACQTLKPGIKKVF